MMTLNGFCDGSPGNSGVYLTPTSNGPEYTGCTGCAVCDPSIPNHETESASVILNRLSAEYLCEFPLEAQDENGQAMLCGDIEWHPYSNRCAEHRNED